METIQLQSVSLHHKNSLLLAMRTGEMMLKSGAETYRVEDTIYRILLASNLQAVNSFVIPTGIMVTIEDQSSNIFTKVIRIKNRSSHLGKIELLNQLSRDYVDGKVCVEDALIRLDEIENMSSYSSITTIIWNGITSSFFSIMFNGVFVDFFMTFFVGIGVGIIDYHLRKKHIINYFVLFICALFIGFCASVYSYLLNDWQHIEPIIIGSIMPLVPGVAFTNAVRDTIGDELLSGISRGIEALFIAICLAAGVALALSLGFWIGGNL